jgi:hypothetical protein
MSLAEVSELDFPSDFWVMTFSGIEKGASGPLWFQLH